MLGAPCKDVPFLMRMQIGKDIFRGQGRRWGGLIIALKPISSYRASMFWVKFAFLASISEMVFTLSCWYVC